MVEVVVKVKNTGNRAGDEVVQINAQDLGSAVDRPQLDLGGFKPIRKEPGEVKAVVLSLKPRDLAYWDSVKYVWRGEKESVPILAGGSSDKLPVQVVLQIYDTAQYKP